MKTCSTTPLRASVIGLGNVFLGDDAFGPLTVETFRCAYESTPDLEVLDLGTPGMDLAPYLYERDLVVIVDAVHANGLAGTLSIFSEEDFVSNSARLRITGHDPGLWESLAHLRLAGHAPSELIVVGMNPASCSFGEGVSPGVITIASEAAIIIATLLMERGVACVPSASTRVPDLWWLPIGTNLIPVTQ